MLLMKEKSTNTISHVAMGKQFFHLDKYRKGSGSMGKDMGYVGNFRRIYLKYNTSTTGIESYGVQSEVLIQEIKADRTFGRFTKYSK